jgi:hypothetical protein
MVYIKINDPKEFFQKLKKARTLKEACLVINCPTEFFRFYDADVVAELLDGVQLIVPKKLETVNINM